MHSSTVSSSQNHIFTKAILIFPHQLFESNPAIEININNPSTYDEHTATIFVIEDPLFFSDWHYKQTFHQQKILLHRASMQWYFHHLRNTLTTRCIFQYIDYQQAILQHYQFLQPYEQWHLVEVDDYMLQKRIEAAAATLGASLHWYQSPQFLTPLTQTKKWLAEHPTNTQTSFYIWQRKQLGLLIDGEQPVGAKWTFDTENRKKLPRKQTIPIRSLPYQTTETNHYLSEAAHYVTKHFSHHPGQLSNLTPAATTPSQFYWPINHVQAQNILEIFISDYLANFGTYQDALSTTSDFTYHSLLSSSLNSGLLTSDQVISAVLKSHQQYPLPMNSLEGFIRQIIGWREYIRLQYHVNGSKQRTNNFFGFTRKLNNNWYQGTTKLLPVDHVIAKVQRTAYAHHIERLMVVGNAMLLCEIDPDEVYRWFMELFIDSYDWVMVPNMYGMSQYADGGNMVTKPYISGSNYLIKMSDYSSTDQWSEIWTSLYWRFIYVHQQKFRKNPRMTMILSLVSKMSPSKLDGYLTIAKNYLNWLDSKP